MILYHIYESCPFLSVLINIDMHLSEKSGSIIFWENFFFDFCSIYCVTSNAAHPETDTLLVGGGGGGGGEG